MSTTGTIDIPVRRSRFYYGWIVMIVAALAMVGTLPGRTQGLGLVTEPLLADFNLDRFTYATINLWATLIGALFSIGVGRFIDQIGSRVVVAVGRDRARPRRRRDEQRHECDVADGAHHADARLRPERAVGGESDDGRTVVPAEAESGDGDLRRRAQHRLHDRVSRGRRARSRAAAGGRRGWRSA